jgi:hypothetical protein
MQSAPEIPSVIGRLLAELSWAGSTIREYRNGGRGFENVLTAEALQALDLLPRAHFLGQVIARVCGADEARQALLQEVESARFTLLPGNHYLRPSAPNHQTKIAVQPDAILESASTYAVIEAKRLRRGSFQPKQLAREFVLALQRAGDRRPLLLLLLPEPPPVPVRGHGRQSIADAISLHIEEVLGATDDAYGSKASMFQHVEHVVCWITWQNLLAALSDQLKCFESQDPSLQSSLRRIVGTVQAAIEWHGDG